tara:strand:- start:1560 stop:1988 length:429 start_codon:yes stop_codon:yes gene_type:complete
MRITESQIRALVREVLNESRTEHDMLAKQYAKGSIKSFASAVPGLGAALELISQGFRAKGALNIDALIDLQSQIPQFMKACVLFCDFLSKERFSEDQLGRDIILDLFNEALRESKATNYMLVRSGSGEAGEHPALDPSNRPR